MAEPRPVPVVPAAVSELSVPADVAELLGEDARLEVGPGQVVTLRPAKLSSAAVAGDVKPLDDPGQLRHARTRLTTGKRAALEEFWRSDAG